MPSFKWYIEAVSNAKFIESSLNSATLSLLCAIVATPVAFVCALSWWSIRQRNTFIIILVLISVTPPETLGILFGTVSNYFELYEVSYLFQAYALTIKALPFAVFMIWGMLKELDQNLVKASRDSGASNQVTAIRIILPLTVPALVSAFLLSFLLSFNDYGITSYLSGATEYLSEYINGKVNSGADPTVFASGGINILMASLFMLVSFLVYKLSLSE
ncbi:MAG: ABC transporter permease subunit [Bacteroidota bacterium]